MYSIQFFRFVAALLVMCHHLEITRSGNRGVFIFFVISGFIMYMKLFAARRDSPFHFFTNRLSKIFLLYWLALMAMYVVRPFSLNVAILPAVFLLPGHYPFIKVSWSLSYELYFYLFTGLAAYLLPAGNAKAFVLGWLMLTSAMVACYFSGYLNIKGTLANFLLGINTWTFVMGLLGGYLYFNYFANRYIPAALPVCLLAVLVLLAIFLQPDDTRLPVATGVLSMLLVCCSVAYERRKALPVKLRAIFKTLGDASYAMYLFAPVLGLLLPAESVTDKIIIIVATICFSVLINRFVEVKTLDLIRTALYKLSKPV